MRWYEYKMETDELHAPDDLKAKLLAMADTLTEEEKARPMMNATQAVPARNEKKKLIRFPAKQIGALAACLAVCAVGYGTFGALHLGGAKSSNAALYAADSSAASTAMQRAVVDSPMAADYSLDTAEMAAGNGMDNGTDVLSAGDAAAAEGTRTVDSAQIIYTADLTLESKDYDAARAALEDALASAGGYLESSSEYADTGSSRSASLTCRVPQENYRAFLEAVAAAGSVTYKNEQAEDVTTQYMDVETRLAALEAQRTRLQQLQQQAENLSDLLQIESSLSDVQYQIESWQSQLDWYSDQVQQCTVYVSLNEVQTYTADEGFAARIGTAFSEGWTNFVNGLQQLAVTLAAAWPAVVLVLAAGAGALAWHKKHRAKKG